MAYRSHLYKVEKKKFILWILYRLSLSSFTYYNLIVCLATQKTILVIFVCLVLKKYMFFLRLGLNETEF